MLIVHGSFTIWLSRGAMVALSEIPFLVVLDKVQGTSILSFEPLLFLSTHGDGLFYVPFFRGHIVIDNKFSNC